MISPFTDKLDKVNLSIIYQYSTYWQLYPHHQNVFIILLIPRGNLILS